MPANLAEIAARFDCELRGAADVVIERVGTLARAGANELTFLANPLYRGELAKTRAAAVVLHPDQASECPTSALISSDPYVTFARIARFLHPREVAEPGIHETAVIADGVVVPASARIGPQVVIEAGTELGESVVIGAGCVVGRDVRIAANSELFARATVMDRVVIGERCVIHPGAVIGSDGFGFAQDDGSWLSVPQLGTVVIGNDVSIGANTTIDRGSIQDTIIEDGVILDNLIQIAHNVRVGEFTAIAACSGIAGSTEIGARCLIAGAAGIIGHLRVCDDVMVTVGSMVTRSITKPGTYSGMLPVDEATRWRRNAARFRKLDELAQRQRTMGNRLTEFIRSITRNTDD
jgi:UDP-3-O-[3-hydroxymyristoyl] glucosamine N-acyltransferase